ncbi:MAG: 6-carboxytetrahydropterin synthase [Bdellovibrionaceae bacterium]|nr:6-carboxytetrahydropterin synthase [Pseudobdellovibrionaceae bacterium]
MKTIAQSSQTVLILEKQNFKFSAAHFLIFDQHTAERLHGHNYQVKVEIHFSASTEINEKGYFIDFNVFKKTIKKTVDAWDEMVLLPQNHQDMKFFTQGPSLEVRFRDRFYVFPVNEVVLLPLTNTSVEQMSALLGEILLKEFLTYGISAVQVTVEETNGQGAKSTQYVKTTEGVPSEPLLVRAHE